MLGIRPLDSGYDNSPVIARNVVGLVNLELREALRRSTDGRVEAGLVNPRLRADREDDEGLRRDLTIDGAPAAPPGARTQLAQTPALLALQGA